MQYLSQSRSGSRKSYSERSDIQKYSMENAGGDVSLEVNDYSRKQQLWKHNRPSEDERRKWDSSTGNKEKLMKPVLDK